MSRLLLALVFCLLATSHAGAWGSEGHRVIAEIAEQYLEPATIFGCEGTVCFDSN